MNKNEFLYSDYFNTMFTVKVNGKLKDKIKKHIKDSKGLWQNLFDDFLRDYAKQNNIEFNTLKVRKIESIITD